jgi:ligand-binding sensor domain-containing protein
MSCMVTIHALSQGLAPIGNWTDHLSYNQAIGITSIGNKIYTATPNGMFSLDKTDNLVERLSKLTGLSSTGISSMGSNESTIILGYTDGNIDLVRSGSISNVNSIQSNPAIPEKAIHAIVAYNDKAYLATSFGIVVLNLQKNEISETYIIGSNGSPVAVYSFCQFNADWYASTAEGIKTAPVTGNNLQDYHSWKSVTTEELNGSSSLYQLVAGDNKLFYKRGDSVFVVSGNVLQLFYHSSNRINAVDIVNEEIATLESIGNNGEINFFRGDGSIQRTLGGDANLGIPLDIIADGAEYYIADSVHGLLNYSQSGFHLLSPSSPSSSIITAMAQQGELLVTANLPTSLSIFENREWQHVNSTTAPSLLGNNKIVSLAFDPASGDLWSGSANDGLLQRTSGGVVTRYKEGSFISPSITSPTEYIVTGIAFDHAGIMWVSNSQASENLVARSNDGVVVKFKAPYYLPGNQLGSLLIDDIGQKWIIAPAGNGLLCFNSGVDLQNRNDDQWKQFTYGIGNGNLPDNEVFSIAKDKNNFIWVGTGSGIGIIQCPELLFTSQGCEAILPVVRQAGFNGYLFHGERVQAITVDAADRKWVGTTNGVWLISADGEKVINRFTTDNSPLPDNDIRFIVIDPLSGEVYIATSKGLCSYRGTATETGNGPSSLLVFPNPVPPGYTGTIGISGVPLNSIVKITELNGRLVYQGKSNGNMFTWNGRDSRGQRISTGVYLVLLSDQQRKESLATKIIFISR